MNTNIDMIRMIQEGLGAECDYATAELVYSELHRADKIDYNDREGLFLVEGVDLIAEATAIIDRAAQ